MMLIAVDVQGADGLVCSGIAGVACRAPGFLLKEKGRALESAAA
jgi:hypothetical protein